MNKFRKSIIARSTSSKSVSQNLSGKDTYFKDIANDVTMALESNDNTPRYKANNSVTIGNTFAFSYFYENK